MIYLRPGNLRNRDLLTQFHSSLPRVSARNNPIYPVILFLVSISIISIASSNVFVSTQRVIFLSIRYLWNSTFFSLARVYLHKDMSYTYYRIDWFPHSAHCTRRCSNGELVCHVTIVCPFENLFYLLFSSTESENLSPLHRYEWKEKGAKFC